jgi:hypothetical protein
MDVKGLTAHKNTKFYASDKIYPKAIATLSKFKLGEFNRAD